VVGIPDSQHIAREAFIAKVGTVSEVKQLQNGFIVFRVREELPVSIPTFSEAREEVLTAWRLEEARKITMSHIEHSIESGNLKAVGAPVMRNVATVASLGDLGQHPAIRRALLYTPVGQVTPILSTPDGRLWVALINSRIPHKPLPFADRRAVLKQMQMGIAEKMIEAEFDNMNTIGNKRSGLRSLYGRLNGIWYNKKALSSMYNH
jgi:hypothetical protein